MEETIGRDYYREADIMKDANSDFGNIANAVSSFGFIIIAISTFLVFVPIVKTNWISMGIGLPVMLTAIAGAILVIFKNHFAAFFAAMFPAFFITHGVIIAYDTKAITLGAVSGADGWMRSVPMIFQHAMVPSSGAFWGLTGVGIALSALTIGWILKIVSNNMDLARVAEMEHAEEEASYYTANEEEIVEDDAIIEQGVRDQTIQDEVDSDELLEDDI